MAALFSPYGNGQFMDASGNPAVGYRLFTYLAGSSTLVASYTDAGGLVAQTNPIILDSLGQVTNGQLWLASGVAYKFILQDAFGAMVDTVDNVVGITSAAAAINQFQPSGLTPTYISANSFTLAGDQTSAFHVGRRLQLTTTAGTVYGTIISSAYTSLTTVTLSMDGVTVLDAGLSAVSYSILTATSPALPAIPSARVYAEYLPYVGTSLVIPQDDTIPQVTEGFEILTASITPRLSTSRIRVRVMVPMGAGGLVVGIAAVFVNNGPNALAAAAMTMEGGSRQSVISFECEYAPGSKAAQNFALRVGSGGGAVYVNGNQTSRIFGGVSRASMVLEELVV